MIEKRFYLNEGEVGILKILDLKEDSENFYLTSSKSDMERVVALLNESHEENEQLKKENNKWIVDYNGLGIEYEWLKKENEDLKQMVNFYKDFQKDARELEEENRLLKQFIKQNCPICGANLELFYEEQEVLND